jgi:hypothetical protein
MTLSLRLSILSVLLLFSFSAGAFDIHEVIYRGQKSESFQLREGSDTSDEVLARVRLEFGRAPAGTHPEEVFIVRLEEGRTTLEVKSSGRVLISQRTPEIRMRRTRLRTTIDVDYRFSFLDLDPIADVLRTGISGFVAKDGSIAFSGATDFFERGFTLRFSVLKKRPFASDVLVFDRILSESGLDRKPMAGGKSLYQARLSDLGVPALRSGLFQFELYASFDSGSESVVNASDLPGGGRMQAKTQAFATDLGTPASSIR